MKLELTSAQRDSRMAFRAFVIEHVAPYADQFDREERIPVLLVEKLAQRGYLAANIPPTYGGQGMDMITFGLLHEEMGRGCSSVRSLLTVHSMVVHAIARFGSDAQREHWLRPMAMGEILGGFALTEPEAGSDTANIQTSACTVQGDTSGEAGYALNGLKRWITFGQIADVFLVFAVLNGALAMFLVPRRSPGLSVVPIKGMSGTRGSMLAELRFNRCHVPAESLIKRPSLIFGASLAAVLDIGRYSVACGCVGIAQACLDACTQYTSQRKQSGVYLRDHQLIRHMLTDMMTNTRAARLLCYQAGYQKEIGDPDTLIATLIAKYFASTAATKIANDAVQIHGAIGLSEAYPLQRYVRDARVMEIIEGSTQIQQNLIAQHASLDAVL